MQVGLLSYSNRTLRVYLQSTWKRTCSQQSRENTQETLPFLSSKARKFRLNNLPEIRKNRSQYWTRSLPLGITLFTALMYVCFVMEDTGDSKDVNLVVKENAEAVNTLPDCSVNKDESDSSNNP